MTITLGPTSSGHGGDAFTDYEVAQMYRAMLDTGVCQNVTVAGSPGGDLEVTAGSGLQVVVATGQAMMYGVWMQNDASLPIALATADPSLPRYDLIVVKKDISANPMISIVKKTGTPASSPVAPTPTQTDSVWELALARIHVVAGATSLSGGDITDERLYATPRIAPLTINSGMFAPGAVDDTALGVRTVDDTETIATNTAELTDLLSAIVNQLKTLKNDGTNWYDPIPLQKTLFYLSEVATNERMAQEVDSRDNAVSGTTDVDYAGYSSTHIAQFVASLSFTYVNGTPQKPKGYVRYYSPRLSTFVLAYFQLANTAARGQYLDGSQATSPGNNQDCVTSPLSFYADANHGIEIHFQDPGGTPSGHVTVGLMRYPGS